MNQALAIILVATLLAQLLSAPSAQANESVQEFSAEKFLNWHQWRGPVASGFSPHADPPIEWGESTNIKWKVAIPGNGSATPIVWGDKIFVLTAIDTGRMPAVADEPLTEELSDEDAPPGRSGQGGRRKGGRKGGNGKQVLSVPPLKTVHSLEILCLDRTTGKVVWQRTANAQVPFDGHHPTHGYASASPTTDGQRLYASFGSYGIYSYTLDGEFLWKCDLGRMQTRRGFGEAISPVVHEDSLIINWDHEGESFIVCLDAKTGDELWRTPRDEETTWGTPLIVEHGSSVQVVTNATGRSRSYELTTGELLWQCGGQVRSPIPSPVALDGITYCMTGYQGYAVNAISLDSKGEVNDLDTLAWHRNDAAPYVSSPLIHDYLLYFTKGEKGILTCLDARSGETVYGPKRLPGIGNLYASLTGAADRIYIADRDGVTLVIKAGPKFQVLATNTLDEGFSASPVLVGNTLLLRGQHHLYCIQNK